MRISFARAVLLAFAFLCLLNPAMYGADGATDGTKDKDSTAKSTAKPDASAKPSSGLTEREQWMMERIEATRKESCRTGIKRLWHGCNHSGGPGKFPIAQLGRCCRFSRFRRVKREHRSKCDRRDSREY